MIGTQIANDMEDQSIGTLGTDLFIGSLPDTPDDAVAVIDTGGEAPDKELPFSKASFQVLVRNELYSAGITKLNAIKTRYHQLTNTTLGDTYFYYILANSDGGHIGRDDNGREVFSINFRTETREA